MQLLIGFWRRSKHPHCPTNADGEKNAAAFDSNTETKKQGKQKRFIKMEENLMHPETQTHQKTAGPTSVHKMVRRDGFSSHSF
jgi:hypothetical protein